MFVITDDKGLVRDISSRKENMQRGMEFPNHTLHEDVTNPDIQIGDHYDGKICTQNKELRKERDIHLCKSIHIDIELRRKEATLLGYSDVAIVLSEESSNAVAKLEQLSNLSVSPVVPLG